MRKSNNYKGLLSNDKLCFSRWLAVEFSDIHKAIILNRLIYYIEHSKEYREGKYWFYSSVSKLHKKDFPFLCEKTISRKLIELEKEGYLIVGNFNKFSYDRTKWFALNYTKIKEADSKVSKLKADTIGVKN